VNSGAESDYERVGGTATGGATFLGLMNLLGKNYRKDPLSFDEAVELAASGDPRKVDKLVGDIYGEDGCANLGLPPTMTAANFGKLASVIEHQKNRLNPQHSTSSEKLSSVLPEQRELSDHDDGSGEPVPDPSLADIAAATLQMIAQASAVLVRTIAQQAKCLTRVFVVGGFMDSNPIARKVFGQNLAALKGRAIFVKHSGFLGSLGSLQNCLSAGETIARHLDPLYYGWDLGILEGSRADYKGTVIRAITCPTDIVARKGTSTSPLQTDHKVPSGQSDSGGGGGGDNHCHRFSLPVSSSSNNKLDSLSSPPPSSSLSCCSDGGMLSEFDVVDKVVIEERLSQCNSDMSNDQVDNEAMNSIAFPMSPSVSRSVTSELESSNNNSNNIGIDYFPDDLMTQQQRSESDKSLSPSTSALMSFGNFNGSNLNLGGIQSSSSSSSSTNNDVTLSNGPLLSDANYWWQFGMIWAFAASFSMVRDDVKVYEFLKEKNILPHRVEGIELGDVNPEAATPLSRGANDDVSSTGKIGGSDWRFSESIRCLDKCIQLEPRCAMAFWALSWVHGHSKTFPVKRTGAGTSAAATPTSPSAPTSPTSSSSSTSNSNNNGVLSVESAHFASRRAVGLLRAGSFTETEEALIETNGLRFALWPPWY
jgi:hypothetical protein